MGDFRAGIAYLRGERGLYTIVAYFFVSFFAMSAFQTLSLPFFKGHPGLFPDLPMDVVTLYTVIMGFGVLGRVIGGLIHYRHRFPPDKKYAIALFVYTTITILEAFQLFMPIPIMATAAFFVGILGVTSYNIRISFYQNDLI